MSTELCESLLASSLYTIEDKPALIKALAAEDFTIIHRVHNWRTYVPEAVESRWKELSDDARVAVYLIAEIMADREEWD